jgi:hypothetical protein
MIKVLKLTIVALVLLLLLQSYNNGVRDGEQQYKQSHRMYMALKSAYHFGYLDAKQGRAEDWDGPAS